MNTIGHRLDPDFELRQAEAIRTKASGGLATKVEVSTAALFDAIRRQLDEPIPTRDPLIELTPRHPFDDATSARIDSYHPGRWDCESDLVYMSPIVQTGPSPGEWDGTVIYVTCPTLTSGVYLVGGYFSGYDTTLSLFGPWGTTTAYNPTTNVSSVVLAQASVSQGLSFSMSCKGSGLGYLASIQLFQQ